MRNLFFDFSGLLFLAEVSADLFDHMLSLWCLFGSAFADAGVVISVVDAARLTMPVLK